MKKATLTVYLTLLTLLTFCQTMHPMKDLIDTTDPGWPVFQEILASATNPVEVLPRDTAKANDAVFKMQFSTKTTMASVAYMTGGVLVDSGWIRILGSGSPRLPRSLPDWNKGKSIREFGDRAGFYLVADDVMGGFFAMNWGALGDELGKVYYLAPDDLKWASTGQNYAEFLVFCFTGDLKKFYEGYHWAGWQKEANTVGGDKAFHFMPPLWSKEGKDIDKDSRSAVPVEELYNYALSAQKQLNVQ